MISGNIKFEPLKWEEEIFNIRNDKHFERLAREISLFQYYHNPVYREYCEFIKAKPDYNTPLQDIPFLPIHIFKTHKVLTNGKDYEQYFESSGTSGMQRSRHYIKKSELYRMSFMRAFHLFYGNPENYCILALLPLYSENKHSSLISMVKGLTDQSECPESGFYLNDLNNLADLLLKLNRQNKKIMLFGVSFALLDLAEKYPLQLNNTIVIETGGMKGQRKELVREELHERLKTGLGVNEIHSEYGMAELLSQAYATVNGRFKSPPWQKTLIRDAYDPKDVKIAEKAKVSGGINIIDLANLYSCSFIETQDIGSLYPDGTFEVLGRFDYSEIRGCNLMVM
ncbi:MAG: acyltransferase [Bacteroidales bacterium]